MNILAPPVNAQTIGTITSDDAPGIDQIITGVIQLALVAAGLLFFAMLIIGGLRYLTAGGDEKAVQEARRSLTNAFIGLIIIVAAFLIAELLFAVFGLESFIQVVPGG